MGPDEIDGYWTVVSSEWRDIYSEPQQLGVGSVSDDEAELTRLIEDPGRFSGVDLERIAHLLCVVSDKLSS